MRLNLSKQCISFLFSLALCWNVTAQHDETAYPASSESQFTAMIENPSSFSSEYRTNIYLDHASEFLGSNLDSANIIYQEMVDFGQSINDEYLTGVAYSSMAMLAGMSGRFEEKMKLERLSLQNTGGNTQLESVMLGSLGESFIRRNLLDSAEIVIEKSIAIVTANQDTVLMAHAYLQKSELLRRQQKYYSSSDIGLKALEKAEHSWTPMKKANVYNIIGKNYFEVGDQEESLNYRHKALAITTEKGYKRFTAELQATLGALYRIKGEFSVAQEYLLKSIPYLQEKEMHIILSEVYSNLALIKLNSKNEETANRYVNEAKALLDEKASTVSRAIFHLADGRSKLHSENYTAATSSFKKLIELGEETNTLTSQLGGYYGLQEIAVSTSDWKNAYTYSDKMNSLRKEADITKQQRLIFDLESKYQLELKNEKIDKFRANQHVQDLLISRRERQLLFTGLALLLAIASIVGFVTAYRTKQKSLLMLNEKNEKLNVALSTNKMLVKEIHHRVKNNLQVVSSLLNIQSRFEKDDTVIKAINSGKFRVQSMSLLHQNLYSNEDLNQINVKKYFTDLANGIVDGYPLNKKLSLDLQVDDLTLDLDTLVPLGLIANELMTNALKYAFSNEEQCELKLSVKQMGEKIRLTVADNGVGMPFDSVPERSKTMGMQLIHSFAKKINASVEIDNFNGAEVKITFEKQKLSSQISA